MLRSPRPATVKHSPNPQYTPKTQASPGQGTDPSCRAAPPASRGLSGSSNLGTRGGGEPGEAPQGRRHGRAKCQAILHQMSGDNFFSRDKTVRCAAPKCRPSRRPLDLIGAAGAGPLDRPKVPGKSPGCLEDSIFSNFESQAKVAIGLFA